jgi:hypothetical protein
MLGEDVDRSHRTENFMYRNLALLAIALCLAACGLTETAASGAAGAASEAEAAKQAQQTEQRVRQQLDAAAQAAAKQRQAGEDAGT